MSFAKLMKSSRKKLNLTQKDISEKLGLSSSQMVSVVERGECYYSADKLRKVCSILDLNYNKTVKVMVSEKYGIVL